MLLCGRVPGLVGNRWNDCEYSNTETDTDKMLYWPKATYSVRMFWPEPVASGTASRRGMGCKARSDNARSSYSERNGLAQCIQLHLSPEMHPEMHPIHANSILAAREGNMVRRECYHSENKGTWQIRLTPRRYQVANVTGYDLGMQPQDQSLDPMSTSLSCLRSMLQGLYP